MNKIEINFSTCTPAPPQGYNVKWWVAGSSEAPKNAGNYFVSPAVFYDTVNPAGTQYEGYIRADCGSFYGNPVAWDTVTSCTDSGDVTIRGTAESSAHGVFVTLEESLPCDVTFFIDGEADDHGTPIDFTASVTVLAGQTTGSDPAAAPVGIIDCLKPTTSGQTTFEISEVCLGITYNIILEIDNPC